MSVSAPVPQTAGHCGTPGPGSGARAPVDVAAAPGAGAPLSDGEFHAFRDLLYERAGLSLPERKKFLLESRLARRLRATGVPSPGAYLELLRSPGPGPAELLEFLDAVTIHETSFFRNRAQLDVFRSHVLTDLVRAQERCGQRVLRLWSAACSSGEEPYTLAMLVAEVLGDRLPLWRVRILATDLARSVLEKARGAVYGRRSVRTAPAYYVQRYFTAEGRDAYRVVEPLRRLVEFRRLNFTDDAGMRTLHGFHVVFCRNALIYFDTQAKRRFVSHFANALRDGGYLFVGHSESLQGITEELAPMHFPGSLGYRKPSTHPERS